MKIILSVILVATFMSLPNHCSNDPLVVAPVAAQIDNRPGIIDEYFTKRNAPLAGEGADFVSAADEYGIDYRLLAAISIRESSGGLHMPYNSFNAWGWNSGGYTFSSFKDAIDFITQKLALGDHYRGKTLREKLQTYNPPSVLKSYADDVEKIMSDIGPTPLSPTYGTCQKDHFPA